jgi:hypothetical protein
MRSLFVVIGMVVLAVPAAAQYSPPQWTADARTGCRIWNSSPEPGSSVSWSGRCVNGLAEGPGILQWFIDGKPGSRFQGELREGLLNGRGYYQFANGSRYDGEYLDDMRNGRGVFTHPDGESYEGTWRDGLPNGSGRLQRPDGTDVSGVWTNGCLRQGDQMVIFLSTRKGCGLE